MSPRLAVFAALLAMVGATLGLTTTAHAVDSSPQASDVGITAKEIHIAVVADVDNTLVPGLFKGSVDGVKAAAKTINSAGGIAGRKLVVDFIDSHLNGADSRNAIIKACAEDFAIVGSAMLIFNNVEDLVGCKDKAGAATGIPDLAVVSVDNIHTCAPVTYYVQGGSSQCATITDARPTYAIPVGPARATQKRLGDTKGVWILSGDTPGALASENITVAGESSLGIANKGRFPLVSASPQSAYTPVVQAIKDSGANYVWSGVQFNGLIALRKEAQLQGVTVDTWQCPTQCYNSDFLTQGGSAVEGTYVSLNYLPYEETGSNKALATAVNTIKKSGGTLDGFAIGGYGSALALRDIGNRITATDKNALTRKAFLAGLASTHNFSADGIWAPVDIGNRLSSSCYVELQVKNGKFVRIAPTKVGTFACDKKNRVTLQVDPKTAEYNRPSNG